MYPILAGMAPTVDMHFNSHWHGRLLHEGLDYTKFSRGTMFIISLTERKKDALKIDELFALYLIDLAGSLPQELYHFGCVFI
jgi:hypothetical protein